MAAACADGAIYVWDLETGNLWPKLEGHSGAVNAVCAFRAQGRVLLASAGHDCTVRVWNPHTGDGTVLRGHDFSVNAVCAFVEDGRVFLASAGGDDTVRVWDASTGEPLHVLTGHSGPVNGICAFSKNGRVFLASAGGDDTVRIWDVEQGQAWRVLTGHTFAVRAVCTFEYEGQAQVASVGDNTVRLWNIGTSDEQILGTHTDRVRALCAVIQGSRTLLASGGSDKAIRIWDVGTRREQESTRSTSVASVTAFHDGGRPLVAAGGDDGVVRLWTMDSGELLKDYRVSKDYRGFDVTSEPVIQVSQFSSDAQSFIAATTLHQVVVWEVQSGRQVDQFDADGRLINAFAIARAAGGLIAVSADDSHRVLIRSYLPSAGFSPPDPVAEQIDSVRALCVIGTGQPFCIIASGADGMIQAWYVEGGYIEDRRGKHSFSLQEIDYLRKGSSGIHYFGRQEILCGPRPTSVRTLSAFQWDDRPVLASAGGDGEIYVWELTEDYNCLAVLKGHTGSINSVCTFEWENRTFLASASDDRTLRIWSVDTQAIEMVIPVQHQALSICFLDGVLYAGLSAGLIAVRLNASRR